MVITSVTSAINLYLSNFDHSLFIGVTDDSLIFMQSFYIRLQTPSRLQRLFYLSRRRLRVGYSYLECPTVRPVT